MKQLLSRLAAFLIAAPLGAQGQSPTQGQAQQPTFRTGVDVITVDVGAIDSRGQPVTDLHGPEFTVKIDGQVRRVVTADLVKYEYTPDTGGRGGLRRSRRRSRPSTPPTSRRPRGG